MNVNRLGVACAFGGALIALYNAKIGGIIFTLGIFCFIMTSDDKKDAPKKEEPIKGESHYRVVGNIMLELDENGKVLGSCALPSEESQRKRIGSNK